MNALARIVKTALKIEPHELAATVLSFLFVFALMFAYNVLKPVRDAMAADFGNVGVATLWTINFVFSIVAVSLYGFAVSRLSVRGFVTGLYGFFALSFVAFWLGAATVPDGDFVDKAFYVWISLFSLFHISVFWSLMADVFTRQQAPRLFAFIASGASFGTLAGSGSTIVLAELLGSRNLMLLAASVLVAIVPLVGILQRLKVTQLGGGGTSAELERDAEIRGNPFAGFSEFVKNPFLLGIAVFIFFYVWIGSFAYFELNNLMVDLSRDERTQIWAFINFTVNTLAIVTAWFATSRIATHFGVATTLAIVPVLVGVGFLAIAVNPLLVVVIVTWIVLKGGNYSITRPGREMLYTIVDRESRFKAKPVIDIVVYRGGDTLAGWSFAGLTTGLGLGLGAAAAIGVGIAIAWAVSGILLGRTYDADTPVAARQPT